MNKPKEDEEKWSSICERCSAQVNGQEDGDSCTDCGNMFCYECLPTECHACPEAK